MALDYNMLTQASNLFNTFQSNQRHEILTVSSLQQVKDFVMNKGDSYMLLDPNADILYIKEVDSIGRITLRAYALQDKTDEIINNTAPATISKSEYDKLLKRLEMLEEGKHAVKKSTEQQQLDFSDN